MFSLPNVPALAVACTAMQPLFLSLLIMDQAVIQFTFIHRNSLFFSERVLLNSTISLNNADVTLSDADEVVRSMRLGTRPGARM